MKFEDMFYGRPNKIKTYKSLYRKHIEPHVKNADVKNWNGQMTMFMLSGWQADELSRRTQIALIRLLGRYVTFAGGPDIGTDKIIRSLERSEQITETKSLSAGEAQKLMVATKQFEPKFYPVLLLALHAGLRRGEIFGLRGADIDVLKKQIKVSRSYNGPTKNGKTRYVQISEELEKALFGVRNILLKNPNDPVFEQFDPNPTLRNVCNRAGIKQIRFHDLRHTFATLALESGRSPKAVQAALGHSSLMTTLSVYWNLIDGDEMDLDFLPTTK